jgi:hypothetical protein
VINYDEYTMQDKLHEIVRKKRDVIVREVHEMTEDTPPTTRAFATGYIFAMQEILNSMERDA